MAQSTAVSFQRPSAVSEVELLSWEISVARAVYQHARNETLVEKLVNENTALEVVDVLTNTKADSVRTHICHALAHLCKQKAVGQLYADAGALAALLTIVNEKSEILEKSVNISADGNQENISKEGVDLDSAVTVIVAALDALTAITQSKRLVPKVATHILGSVNTCLRSQFTNVRISAAALSLNLFQAGPKVWEMFIQAECMGGVQQLFRLANNRECLLGLKLIECLCADERLMSHVRHVVGMEPITFHSNSPNAEISAVANTILTTTKHQKIWTNIPNVDPLADLTVGRAIKISNSKNFSVTPTSLPKTAQSGQVDSAQFLNETKRTTYPFMLVYPHENQPAAETQQQ